MQRFFHGFDGARIRRGVVLLGAAALLIWLLFFDSHNLLQRVQLHAEYNRLQRENAALEERLERLEADLEAVESDETVERLAREEYGMRRPGETVYQVESEEQEER